MKFYKDKLVINVFTQKTLNPQQEEELPSLKILTVTTEILQGITEYIQLYQETQMHNMLNTVLEHVY